MPSPPPPPYRERRLPSPLAARQERSGQAKWGSAAAAFPSARGFFFPSRNLPALRAATLDLAAEKPEGSQKRYSERD